MRNHISLVLVGGAVAAGILVASSAQAGWKASQASMAVTIDDVNRIASGAMGAVRNSADNSQQLACWLDGTTSGVTGNCHARSVAGNMRTCTTTNANLIQVIGMASSDSYIRFGWNASNQCVTVQVSANSAMEVKAH